MKKKAGKAGIHLSNEHYADVQRLVNLGSWKLDINSGVVEATEQAKRIFGVEKEHLSLEFVQSRALPEYRLMLDSALEKLINEKAPYNVEYAIRRYSDDEIRHLVSIAEYDQESSIVTGSIQDITDRKNIEKALSESEQRYRSLFDNSVSGIVYCDSAGRILEANRTMLQMLGSPSLEETKKINMLEYPMLVKVGFSADFRKAVDTGTNIVGSAYYTSKWGTNHYFEYTLTLLKDDQLTLGVMGKIEDMTERKQAEERIESLLREKDLILREVHHRIKNNMTSIESLLKLQINATDDSCTRESLQEAVGRLSSMSVLYEKLYQSKDFMQTSSVAYLSKLIEDIAAVFPGNSDIKISTDIDEFMLPSDITFSLGIIINELITNSLKYAFANCSEEKSITVSAKEADGEVWIVVRDNGCGFDIPGQSSGGGFGLQLVRMLTEQIGGAATFSNDCGTVFSITFRIKK